ncbi:MAG TPA: hypothetical protein VFU21_07900 [Kofleriaceae bacterium]|nr:hypothetical protein [Kofleriaceae bacterium]
MSAKSAPTLADRVAVLRDEVLATADTGEREPPGSEVFDAVLRGLATSSETTPGLDLALHDAVARRLAWGDTEAKVLADAGEVCRRMLAAAQRALRDPADELLVAAAVAEAACAAARIVAILVLGRVARERAAQLREEMAQERLGQALERQREELARLEEAVARAQGRSGER